MRLLGIFLLVLAVLSIPVALNTRPPADMHPDEAAAAMIGAILFPIILGVAGLWCTFKKRRKAVVAQPGDAAGTIGGDDIEMKKAA